MFGSHYFLESHYETWLIKQEVTPGGHLDFLGISEAEELSRLRVLQSYVNKISTWLRRD